MLEGIKKILKKNHFSMKILDDNTFLFFHMLNQIKSKHRTSLEI